LANKEKLYKRRLVVCWFLFLTFGIVGLVSLCSLIVRLVFAANPLPVLPLATFLMSVSAFCFAMAQPYLLHVFRVWECYKRGRSTYESFRDCIGPFPTILFLERIVFRLAPNESKDKHPNKPSPEEPKT
jgi:hypothetical protein